MEKSLDTGDLLFYNFNCDMCFTPRDVLSCKLRQYLRGIDPDKPASMGFLIRTAEHRILVVSDYFGRGEVTIQPYYEFLNKPFIRMVKTRQVVPEMPKDSIKKSLEFLQELLKSKKNYELGTSSDGQDSFEIKFGLPQHDFFESFMSFKLEKIAYHNESKLIVPKYLDTIGILNRKASDLDMSPEAMDRERNAAIMRPYKLSRSVTIRSYNT